jgi:hypothetical protein
MTVLFLSILLVFFCIGLAEDEKPYVLRVVTPEGSQLFVSADASSGVIGSIAEGSVIAAFEKADVPGGPFYRVGKEEGWIRGGITLIQSPETEKVVGGSTSASKDDSGNTPLEIPEPKPKPKPSHTSASVNTQTTTTESLKTDDIDATPTATTETTTTNGDIETNAISSKLNRVMKIFKNVLSAFNGIVKLLKKIFRLK